MSSKNIEINIKICYYYKAKIFRKVLHFCSCRSGSYYRIIMLGEKEMREIIKNVSEVLGNLYTLKLVDINCVHTHLKFDEQTHKYILSVSIKGIDKILDLCLELFQKLRDDNIVMSVCKNEKSTTYHYGILIVEFYEQ